MIASAHVIGMGRLGRHLALRLETLGVEVKRWSRTATNGGRSMEDWKEATPTDACFLAVPDEAIEQVANSIADSLPSHALMVHHAGAVPLDVLPVPSSRRAVMWPPMTFGPLGDPDWDTLPMGVETEHEPCFEWSKKLAPNAFRLTAISRPKLHLGAVLAGNLTAAWIGAVEHFLKQHQLPFSSLEPLIQESVNNALKGSALKTVSGPASRNDQSTLNQQVKALNSGSSNRPEFAELHRLLTNLILKEHGHPELPPVQTTPGRN